MKKTMTALLLCALLLASCGSTGGTASDTTASSGDTTAAEPVVKTDKYGREYVESALPETMNFNGTTVNIWCRNTGDMKNEFAVEEAVGEIMNDAIFDRNRSVEERLNIKFAFLTDNADLAALQTSILAGAGAYDIAAVHCSQGAAMAQVGAYQNLLNYDEYLALDKPWWNQMLNEELDVYGYLPMVCGDISLSSTKLTLLAFFNQRLYDEYYDQSAYDIVKSGKWTLDTLHSMTTDICEDLNGDTVMDNNDFYAIGLRSDSLPLDGFVAGLDLAITTTNTDGVPELTFNSERAVDAFQKLTKLVMESPGTYTSKEGGSVFSKKFVDGQFIFFFGTLKTTEGSLRDMEDSYGILPLPKYDENQDAYYTLPQNAFSMMVMPADAVNCDAAAAALEALCEESYRTVTPAYFEVALKAKYFHDNESAQMFDLIMDGIQLNFGSVYQTKCIGSIGWLIRDLSKDFSSTYAANQSVYEAAFKTLLENLKTLSEQ